MDSFDYTDEAVRPSRDRASLTWNVLTVVVFLIFICVALAVVTIFINPYIGFNPFPPPTIPALISLPTATPTPRQILPATWTPTFTPESTSTSTPAPTLVATIILPTEGAQLTTTPGVGLPFEIIPGDPVPLVNYGHQELGCNWMGVTGRVFDLTDAPIAQGLTVQLGGTLDGKPVEKRVLIGAAAQFYGLGAYEIPLGDKPIASSKTLWVQLFDQAEIPLSEKIFFDTYADCEKSLILIDFKQVKEY